MRLLQSWHDLSQLYLFHAQTKKADPFSKRESGSAIKCDILLVSTLQNGREHTMNQWINASIRRQAVWFTEFLRYTRNITDELLMCKECERDKFEILYKAEFKNQTWKQYIDNVVQGEGACIYLDIVSNGGDACSHFSCKDARVLTRR